MTRSWVHPGGGLVAVVLSAMLMEPAAALPPSPALIAFQSGKFMEAADVARGASDAQAWSLAARALLAQVLAEGNPSENGALLDESIALSHKALSAVPDSVEARLDLAFALGIKGRRASKLEAFRRGYASQGKRLIDEALALDPYNAWAYAMLGGWNCEVLRRGGHLAGKLYGAQLDRGLAAFDKAMSLAPDDPAIALQYAIALLGTDPEKHSIKARALLDRAAGAHASDAVEGMMIKEARRLGLVMESYGARAASEDFARRKI